jgi:signal transduction histidine kinase
LGAVKSTTSGLTKLTKTESWNMDKELKILMLEDQPDEAGLIERVLRKDGLSFATRRVDTRDEFVSALKEFLPDVVLSDHSLPQFNSIEALKICKKQSNHIAFILVTGAVSEEFAVSCLKQGADDYVLKSNLVRLPSAILNSLKQKQVEHKRKKAERTLRKQNDELVKINKELDSFVYSVSHNLRAPLMSVLGLLTLARSDDQKYDTTVGNYFNMMEFSIHKLDNTLKEILDYSRNARSEIKKEKVIIHQLLDDGFERLKYLEGSDKIEKHISIDDQCPLYSDAYRLSVIINNLISNAIKYRDLTKEKPFINIDVKITEKSFFLLFEDNGIGISEEYVKKIFDMFFRATERSEGAGLGLYIVKETVDKLGGKVSVESVLGEGVAFKIEVPNNLPAEGLA